MSDEREANQVREHDEAATRAVFKPSRWPGLIWAVPLAALAIIAWLGISAFLKSGPTVTVEFPIVGGVKAGNTKVTYEGFDIGTVEAVQLEKSLKKMKVKLHFSSAMSGHLGPGTQYWIVGNSFSFANLSSIKDLITGPVIGIDPKPGDPPAHPTGLGKPPVLKDEPKGETLTLVADKMSNISPGSPIYFKGYRVGEVQGVDMRPGGRKFDIYAFIEKDYEPLVNSDSKFWYAGGVRVSTGGSGPGIQMESVPALLMGAIAFETPTDRPGAPVRKNEQFTLYSGETAARAAPQTGAVSYQILFPGGPHGLAANAPVQLEGAQVGSVTQVAMRYAPQTGRIETLVDIALQPQRIALDGAQWDMKTPRPQMDALLDRLIGQGLRAELASSVPVVGGKLVQLELIPGQKAAQLQPGNPPRIPAFGAGGGVGQMMAQVNDVLAKLNAMPLQQIGDEVHQATAQLAKLSQSTALRHSLQRLDRTVAQVEDITRRTDAALPQILDQVKQSAAAAQSALAQVQGMMSARGGVNPGPETSSLPHALYELTQAAESLRALTDFLNAHPAALLTGRGG